MSTETIPLLKQQNKRKIRLMMVASFCFGMNGLLFWVGEWYGPKFEVDPIIWTTGGFCLERKNHAI